MPQTTDQPVDLNSVKTKAQFFLMENRSPIVNGSFERWEIPGPINWEGNFTYKSTGDPLGVDIQMFSPNLDGDWSLRIMPNGKYFEMWQDAKLPELEGGMILDITGYARNPVPRGFAMRLTYFGDEKAHVEEIYPEQRDEEWTRYHARIGLPEDVWRSSVRLYLTRDSDATVSVVVDAISVQVIGSTGEAGEQ